MINGEKILRERYPNLDEKQYQSSGIDLTLKSVAELVHDEGVLYGLTENAKVLPKQVELETTSVMIAATIKDVFTLDPHTAYVATTKEKIKIEETSGQLYLPRSSLLRAGIDVRTAWGDAGFNGHLQFLIINHTDRPFVIEKGARFAQLVDIQTEGVENGYDGDYNE